MALTNFTAFFPDAPTAIVDSTVTSNIVVGGAIGASEASSVEGTAVDTVGMKSLEVVAKSLCFNLIKASNSFSVSLN